VRGVHLGFSWLRLPTPKDQGFQGCQPYLSMHNTPWLLHHVSGGMITAEFLCLDCRITSECHSVPFMVASKSCKNPYLKKKKSFEFLIY
jgi:hypothetical protein